MSNLNKQSVPLVQRALVLQGGGALGAYQAGVFKSLYEKIKGNQFDNNEKDLSILLWHVKQKQTWLAMMALIGKM